MHKLLEVPRRNFARARLTISLALSSPTKGVILVITGRPAESVRRRGGRVFKGWGAFVWCVAVRHYRVSGYREQGQNDPIKLETDLI